MTEDRGQAGDNVAAVLTRENSEGPKVADRGLAIGRGLAVIHDQWGSVKQAVEFENLITQIGDQVIMDRFANISAPNVPSGMRLGTGGATAAAKTGAGAAIVTYITGSQKAFEGGYPTSALNVAARRITWRCIWPAGTATNSAINEWVVTNETPLTNVAGAAANTVSRAVTGSALNKTALDSLTITWTHDFQGT